MPHARTRPWLLSAGSGLAVLSFVNLFNYLDRYVISALVESLKHSSLALSDTQSGSLMFGFLTVYTLAAPLFGVLGDRRSRSQLIAFGVGCWSAATVLSGFAGSYLGLLAARASVGIGEAAYGTIAPGLLSDYFPQAQRGRVMAVFFCAIPVGSALGYVAGGLIDSHFGWRAAFFAAGLPGFGLAALCWRLYDPPRGSQESAGAVAPGAWPAYGLLLRNRPYGITVLGYAAYTFAVGGLAYWMPAFLERIRGMPPHQATVSFGAIVVVTGFVGTFIGGWLGDLCTKRSPQGYLWVSAAATLAAAPFVWYALTTTSNTGYLACMVAAQLLLFLSTGPINATIINLVLPAQRASAVALEVFVIHLLGDAISPLLIGRLSDASSLGEAVKIVPVAVLVSGALWVWAAREQARAH